MPSQPSREPAPAPRRRAGRHARADAGRPHRGPRRPDAVGHRRASSCQRGYTLDQTMLALLRANPDAFINGNVNLLKPGAVLRVPPAQDAAQLAPAEAAARGARPARTMARTRARPHRNRRASRRKPRLRTPRRLPARRPTARTRAWPAHASKSCRRSTAARKPREHDPAQAPEARATCCDSRTEPDEGRPRSARCRSAGTQVPRRGTGEAAAGPVSS